MRTFQGARTSDEYNAVAEFSYRVGIAVVVVLLCMILATSMRADTLTLHGTITQSVDDGTGPAANNPSLNNIHGGDDFIVTLSSLTPLNAVGTYNLGGSSLLFSVLSAGVTEDAFDSVSLTISKSGNFAQFSLLGCLITGSGCGTGNSLSLNFMVPFADLVGQDIAAQAVPFLQPLDLLEDDGATDIQGTVARYSNDSPASAVPEPASLTLFGFGAAALARRFRSKR